MSQQRRRDCAQHSLSNILQDLARSHQNIPRGSWGLHPHPTSPGQQCADLALLRPAEAAVSHGESLQVFRGLSPGGTDLLGIEPTTNGRPMAIDSCRNVGKPWTCDLQNPRNVIWCRDSAHDMDIHGILMFHKLYHLVHTHVVILYDTVYRCAACAQIQEGGCKDALYYMYILCIYIYILYTYCTHACLHYPETRYDLMADGDEHHFLSMWISANKLGPDHRRGNIQIFPRKPMVTPTIWLWLTVRHGIDDP